MITSPSLQRTTINLIRLFLVGLLLTTWAGQPRSSYSAPAVTSWYVAPGGSDSNSCTTALRPCEHIQAAINRAFSGDTINIAAGTYFEPLTILDRSLTLQGQSAATTFLDGNQLYSILTILRSTQQALTINISGLTFQHGKSSQPGGAISNDANSYLTLSNSAIVNNTSSNGGGIYNQGFMNLINVTISNNTVTGGFEGGGIYNVGFLELSNVTLSDNRAPIGGGISNLNTLTVTSSFIGSNSSTGSGFVGGGGGIYNRGVASNLYLFNSTLSGNQSIAGYGGAIFNDNILISNGAVISGNQTTDKGGGIYNSASGQIIFTGGTLLNNTAQAQEGGALHNIGTTQLNGTLITGNKAGAGGGIYNATNGRLTVGTSTVITNTASGSPGGGIDNLGTLTVTQSALIYNAASTSQGGGLSNAGTAQLTNVTISDNTAQTGGGVQNSGGALSLQYSTVSQNSSPALNNASGTATVGNSILTQSSGNSCNGTISSADYNLDTGTSCGFSQSHDLSNTDPQIGPLRDNGGNSLTRAIAFSSPAVDSANASVCPPTDQRGVARPQGDACDRGAYEVVGYTNPNPVDIGANQCVTSTVTINDRFAIGRMLAGVNLSYAASRTDLTIRLLSPGFAKVTLLGPAAADGQNLDTMFDDSASAIVPAGDQDPSFPYYDNTYKPTTPLLQLRGLNIQGTWKLEVCNSNPAATGTLNRWVLVVPEVSDFKTYLPIVRRR
jgi:subtilisin-like proprotein convertase family protein